MAQYPLPQGSRPGYWRAFGHSYIENQLGTADQTGRPDGIFRDVLSLMFNEWQNWAVTGSRVMIQGVQQGGYARMLQAVPGTVRTAPYVSNGGATLLCWGINDIGLSGGTDPYLSAYLDAMRTCISRARMSTIREDTHASVVYGAGFTQTNAASEWVSGTSYRTATATTNATITITLPADYDGSPVVLCFNGIFNGGTGTFSGTAGVTGTFTTSAIIPIAAVSHCPRIKRITNLTSANANQTIIFTATAFDASGTIDFDCWWIEAANPPPVVVMDIAKLPNAGYAGYAGISGNSAATNDAIVDRWNAGLYAMCQEFDTMVQVAYIDDALGKNPIYFWAADSVHPVEYGSAAIAQALKEAADRVEPPALGKFPAVAYMNPPSPRGGQVIRVHRPGNTWYTAEYDFIGAAYTLAIGDLFAIPFQVTNPRMRLNMFALEVTTAALTTGATIRWGLYDDPSQSGYPFGLMTELTSSTLFSVGTTTGVKTSPASPTSGFIDKPLDAGVFWLAFKASTLGTGTGAPGQIRTLGGKGLLMPNVTTTGLPLTTTAGYMGYLITGQGAGALPSQFPTGAALRAEVPYVGFRTV